MIRLISSSLAPVVARLGRRVMTDAALPWTHFLSIALEIALTLLSVVVLGVGLVAPTAATGARGRARGRRLRGRSSSAPSSGCPGRRGLRRRLGRRAVSVVFKRLFLAAGALVALLAWPSGEPNPSIPRGRTGEALGLMVLSVTGMCVLVSSRELALLYTGLELVTMPLVALVAIHPRNDRAARRPA